MPTTIKLKQIDNVELTAYIQALLAAEISLVSNTISLTSGIDSLNVSFGAVLSGVPSISPNVYSPAGQPIIYSAASNITTSGFLALFSNAIPSTGYNFGYIGNI